MRPNFSEGRDQTKIARIVAEIQDRPGVALLDVEQNADTTAVWSPLSVRGRRSWRAYWR